MSKNCTHTGCATAKQSGICDYASCPKALRLKIAAQIAAGMWANVPLIEQLAGESGELVTNVSRMAFAQADALIQHAEQTP